MSQDVSMQSDTQDNLGSYEDKFFILIEIYVLQCNYKK